jgi:hypothetical protein
MNASSGRRVRRPPALYAIDTVIPLISLDQRSTWYPDPPVLDLRAVPGPAIPQYVIRDVTMTCGS